MNFGEKNCADWAGKNMLSVGIIGLGTIGNVVAKALDDGISGMRLAAIASGRRDRAIASIKKLSKPVDLVTIDDL